jgi:hypothetical protein
MPAFRSLTPIRLDKLAWIFPDNAFEHAIERYHVVKTTLICHRGNAVEIHIHKSFTGFIDAHFIQEVYIGLPGMLFEITTK